MQIEIDKIIFSHRKTYSLQVNEDAKLILKVPINTDDKDIKRILEKHRMWILKKISFAKSIREKIKIYKFKEGEEFLFLGKFFKLTLEKSQVKPIIINNQLIISSKKNQNIRSILIKWYKNTAYSIFLERINYYSDLIKLKYKSLKVSSARKRWGSCSSKGDINISWRLVMAPIRVIDYVIIHELIHLKIRKHSKKFWYTVQSVIPDYKECKKWLKDNEPLMRI